MKLNTAKASPTALLSAAKNMAAKGQHFDAEQYLMEILRRDEKNPMALALLAETWAAQGRTAEASYIYVQLIRTHPGDVSYKERFIDLNRTQVVNAFDTAIEDALVACLRDADQLNCARMQVYWLSHLYAHPEFQSAFQLRGRKFFDPENAKHFDNITNFKPLFIQSFLLGIRSFVVVHPVFEEFITHIRKHLLNGKMPREESLVLADALSHYSFLTDFILDTTDEEQKTVDSLRARLESGGGDALDVALFACYEPLFKLKNADDILKKFSETPALAAILKTQIENYNALRDAAAAIPALTAIDAEVSKAVRKQYEEFPYPRWTSLSRAALLRKKESEQMHPVVAPILTRRKFSLLIAGCGTGQEACGTAMSYPQADILAVDLSRQSLAYAATQAKKYDIKNVTFRHADILQLGVLDQRFDCISSVGVLHHMEDPVRGWTVLRDLLKPDGVMTLAFYSKIARKDVLRAQAIAKQAGYGRDARGMKSFRKASPRLLDPDTLENVLIFPDCFSLSMYRDLLFHVQEHDYDIPELEKCLEKTGMEFVGFNLDPPVAEAYAKRYPNDPSMTDLKNWHVFEQDNPSTFRTMYYFWCRRKKQ